MRAYVCECAYAKFLYRSSLVNLKDGTGTGTVESRLLPTEKSKLANR